MGKNKNIWKRFAKIIVIIYFAVFCIPASLYFIVRTPAVQKYIVNKTTEYLSNELNTNISIEKIKINFFLDIIIENVEIDDLHQKTLLKVDKIKLSIYKIRNIKNKLNIQKIELVNPIFNFITYENEEHSNIQFIIDYFSPKTEKDDDPKPYEIKISKLNIVNAHFILDNQNKKFANKNSIDFNHLNVSKINLDASNIEINKNIKATIKQLSAYEKSGFDLLNLSTKLEFNTTNIILSDLLIETSESDIDADLDLHFNSIDDFKDFIYSVRIDGKFNSSKLSINDVSFFASELKEYELTFDLHGEINGTVNNLKTKNLFIKTANETFLDLSCSISGLPNIDETFFDVNLHRLNTTSDDIKNILTNIGVDPNSVKDIYKFANINLSGSFIGFINSFYTECNLISSIGYADASFSYEHKPGTSAVYKGKLVSNKFDIGTLMQEPKLGIITADLNINGKGTNPKTMNTSFSGRISTLGLNNYSYSNIIIDAKIEEGIFDGNIDMKDENIDLVFNGKIDFSDSIPAFAFNANVENAKLHNLNLKRNEFEAELSADFDVNFSGTSIDNFLGNAILTEVKYIENNKKYYINHLTINQTEDLLKKKHLNLNSDFVKAEITGNYQLSRIGKVIDNFIADYILMQEREIELTDSDYFDIKFDIHVLNFDIIRDLFIPELSVSPNTVFSGTFNSKNNIVFSQLDADYIEYSAVKLEDATLKLETFSQKIYLTLLTNKVNIADNFYLENLIASSVISNDIVDYSLYWDNQEISNSSSGDVKGRVKFKEDGIITLGFENSRITIEDNNWQIAKGDYVIYKEKLLLVNNFKVQRGNQSIFIHGIISDNHYDRLIVQLNKFDLENINSLTKSSGLSLKGHIDGDLHLSNLFTSPYFISNLKVKDFYLEDVFWGDISLISTYKPDNKSINAELILSFKGPAGVVEPLKIKGVYLTDKETDNINFSASLRNYNLRNIDPFLAGQLKVREGFASGNINITGSLNEPEINGSINLLRTNIFVNYLNTSFFLTDSIFITKNSFFAEDINLKDARGNGSKVNLMVRHQNFNDVNLDVRLTTENDFLFMNTQAMHNSYFYGTVFVNGNVFASGPINNITLNVIAKTGRGTKFFLPMDQAGTVYESNFISFINPNDTIKKEQEITKESEDLKFKMVLDLEVTNEAEMQIIFDPKLGDIMRGKGEGNLRIDFDLDGDFLMFGELTLVEGDYLFTLANVINKKFFIQPGGSIKWDGDAEDAKINITTFYPIQTRLYDLVSHIDTSHIYRRKIPVNLELILKENLMTPDISFNIDLPQSDENTKNLINSILSSEQEINRQVFALLVLRSFIAPEQSSFNAPISQGLGATSNELIYNQLSNWLSQISKDFDLGVNYKRGTELTNDELEIIFSTQVFNDRLKIESNVGMSGNRVIEGPEQRQQQLVGDFNAEYKLTPDGRISLRGFNRSNPFDIISQNSLYTQGIGIFIRKDFERFRKKATKQKAIKTVPEIKNKETSTEE